jgi:preprotein translocase subunit SecE
MKPVLTYFSEIRNELSRVTWPKRNEVIKLTLIVLLVSAIVGLYVGGLDYIFTNILRVVLVK